MSFFDVDKARRNMSKSTLYIVGYGRLSFDEDGENYCSILNQSSILEEYYKTHYGEADAEFQFIADDNVSGYKFERRGFFEVLNLIEDGKCNILLAKDLSRIGRHGAMTQLFIEQCEHAGVRIIALAEYDSHKESDEITLGIRTWSNERLVKDTSAKILRVVRHKQKEGTWFCAAPYGYNVISYEKGLVEVDEEAAEVLHRIKEMFLEKNYGINKIAKILTEEGVPTPTMREREKFIAQGKEYRREPGKAWNGSQIAKMLDDDFYIGTLRTGKYRRIGINGQDVRNDADRHNVFEDHHEAIFSKEDFARIQEKRKKNVEGKYRGFQGEESLFHGMLRCGDCGSTMYVYSRPGLNKQYVCSKYFKYGKTFCTRHSIKEKTLVAIVLVYLGVIREQAKDIIQQLDKEVSQMARSSAKQKANKESMMREIEALPNEMNVIEEQRINQIIAHPEREEAINGIYDEMYSKAQEKTNRLQEAMSQLEDVDTASANLSKKARTALGIIDEVIERGEITRQDAEALFDTITVYEDMRIEIKLKVDLTALGIPKLEHVDRERNQKDKVLEISSVKEIGDGDPLEIFTDHDGEVVLKKYSPIGEIATIAKDYTDSLYRTLGHVALISDRDAVVSASGANKREYVEKPLSPEVDQILQSRQLQVLNLASGAKMIPVTNDDRADSYSAQIVAPILADGEIIGGLILLSRESGVQMSDIDHKVAETTANIVGRQMEQ